MSASYGLGLRARLPSTGFLAKAARAVSARFRPPAHACLLTPTCPRLPAPFLLPESNGAGRRLRLALATAPASAPRLPPHGCCRTFARAAETNPTAPFLVSAVVLCPHASFPAARKLRTAFFSVRNIGGQARANWAFVASGGENCAQGGQLCVIMSDFKTVCLPSTRISSAAAGPLPGAVSGQPDKSSPPRSPVQKGTVPMGELPGGAGGRGLTSPLAAQARARAGYMRPVCGISRSPSRRLPAGRPPPACGRQGSLAPVGQAGARPRAMRRGHLSLRRDSRLRLWRRLCHGDCFLRCCDLDGVTRCVGPHYFQHASA